MEDKALANSEVTSKHSLPTGYKSCWVCKKVDSCWCTRWEQPEACSCRPVPGGGRGEARERKGALPFKTNRTVTQTKSSLSYVMEGSKCQGQEVEGTESSANQVSPKVSGEFLEAVTGRGSGSSRPSLYAEFNHFVLIQAPAHLTSLELTSK